VKVLSRLVNSLSYRHIVRRFATSYRPQKSRDMRIVPIPLFEDNYSYFIIDEATKNAFVVDPAVPATVLAAAKTEGITISHILTTHHHWDHADGNTGMVEALPNLVVCGGDSRIPAITKTMIHDDTFTVGSLTVKSLFTPCHTSGHLLYYVTDSSEPNSPAALFTGDTLFVAGCGRFFEGTGTEMHRALNVVIASLPLETLVYVGHEYTLSNLKFALHIENESEAVKSKIAWATKRRAENLPTVPSTIGDELSFNPFMRVNQLTVRKSVGLDEKATPEEVMAALREAKNNFK